MKHTLKIAFLFSLISVSFFTNAQVVINEIQTSNTKTFFDENYSYDDWIEIYNAGAASVNLNGYGISDDSLKPYKFIFPDYNLAAGAYVTVFAADTNESTLTHWETAVKASDSWKYKANASAPSANGWTTPTFNDASWSSGAGGIGMADSDDGTTIAGVVSVYMRRSFTITDTSKIFDAVLNMDYDDGFVAYLNGVEIARVNLGTPGNFPLWNEYAPLSHEAVLYQNQYPDSFHLDYNTVRALLVNGTNVLAVETHNTSGAFTDMSSNPYLSFSILNGSTFFPAPPTWFHKAANTYLHANFKISKTGETIFLTNATNSLLDKKATGNLEIDNSIARVPDGNASWCLTDVPTPNASNNSTVCKSGYATIPIFSLLGGFYTGTRSLTLSTTFPGGSIRYTTDGSNVTETSTIYSGPISISATQTIRARVFATNAIGSTTVTRSYFINLTCRLPIVSLTTDPLNLNDYNTGIFANGPGYTSANPHFGANYWLDMEKDVTVEYYERDKSLQFQFNAGMEVTGGWSRAAGQKSLEIKMGDKYGLSNLNYPLESYKPWITKWDDFVLHMAGNDRDICHMRDALMNRVLKPTFNNYVAYEPCLLMLNGANWGIYYFRENDDHHWVETNYGYKPSEIDFLKESYFYPGIEVKKGSDSAFFSMYNYATTTSPSDPAFYSTISSMMDLQNMADYFIAETYYPNDDWMGGNNNNLKLWRPKKGDGKFKYLIYDLEFGLGYSGSITNNMLGTARNPSPHNYNSDIFDAFTQNPTYKRYFINRYADLINTIFLPANIQSTAYALRDTMKYDYHFQNQKWSGADSTQWISNIATMMTFANGRPAYARNFVQSEYGMTSQVTLTLQVSPAGAGVIQISTITPTTYPWNGVYFNGNPVTITAIPNPGYTFDHWRSNVVISSNNTNQSVTYNFTSTDAITCYFTGAAASPQLAFSELNYHSDSLNEAGDWIEIHNRSNFAVDLSNWIFRDDADNHAFKFPVTTSIPANGYLVLASDLAKFSAIHPTVTNVIGDYGFDFSNGSEELRLFDRNDQLFTSFTYSDQFPFPAGADGLGYTMERLDETASGDDGNNWFAGCLLGSPGRAYSGPVATITAPTTSAICTGSSVSLNVNPISGATYQWYRNNVIMSGSIGASINTTSAGVYSVQVNSGGCSATSAGVTLTAGTTEQISSVTNAARCGAGSLALSATGTSALNWFADSTTATILFTGNTFNTPSISLTTNYFVQASGSCPSVRTRVVATVNAVTAAPVASDVSRCGTGSVLINASAPAVINWYDSASGGNLVNTGTTFSTPNLSINATYYISAGTACPSPRVPVNVIINAITASPVVTNASNCGTGSVLLIASDTAVIRWYSAATGGTLLFTGTNFNTPSISSTTNYYVEAGTACPSSRVIATATIDIPAAPPTVADVARCGNGTVTLTSNSSTTAWYSASSGGTLLGSGVTFITPTLSSSTIYYVQSGTACPSSRVAVSAIVNGITAVPIVTNASNCGPGSVLLIAADTAAIRWYSSASGGTLLFTGTNYNTPVISSTTNYYVEAGSVCASSRVIATATIDVVAAPPTVANVARCGSGTITLTSNSSTSAWYSASSGGTLLGTGINFTTPTLSNSTIYYVQSGTTCPSARVAVSAVVNGIAAAPVVTNASNCGPGSVLLIASDTAAIRWYSAASGGTLLFTGTNYNTPVISSTTNYYVEAGSVCASSRIVATATIDVVAAPPTVADVARCGNGTLTLTSSSSTTAWYSASSGGTLLGTGINFTTPTLSNSTIYYVQSGTTCPSARVAVSAIVNGIAAAPVVTNASNCGPGSILLIASDTAAIRWYSAASGGTLLFTGTNYNTPVISSTTNYYVEAGSVCASSRVIATATIDVVAAPPTVADVARCGNGTITLTSSSSTTAWYSASSGGTLLGTGLTFTTPSLNSSATYYVQSGTTCPSARVAVSAVVNGIAAAPVVTNASNCGPGSILLIASDTAAIRWYSAASGGTLLFTGTNYNTPVISSTTNYYVEAGSVCASSRIVATATIDVVAAPPTVADVARCGNGTITLTSSSSTTAWYSASSGGTLLGTGLAFTTPTLSSSAIYYVQSGTTCPSARVAVNAIINLVTANPTVINAEICGNGSLILVANDTATVRWYASAIGGSVLFTGSTFTTPVLSTTTTYYAQAGNVCVSNRIPVTATIKPITPDPNVTDVTRCGAGSFVLQATSSSIVNWFDAPNGSLLSSGTSFTTPFLNSSTSYFVQAGTDCPSSFVQVNATISTTAADPIVTDNSRCGTGSVNLTASSPETIKWYTAVGGTLLFTGSNFATPSISATTIYYAQAGDVCISNFVPVTATINQQEADPTTVGASSCGPASMILLANGSGTINWFDAINGTIVFTGNSLTTPLVTVTTILYVQTAGICPSNFVPVEATINPITTISVSDASSCGSSSITLNGTSTETITWYDAPGGNILATGPTFVTPVLTVSNQYFAAAGGICPSAPVAVNAIVNSIPVISLGNDTAIESGNTITLDAGAGFASYLWNTSAMTQILTTGIGGNYSVLVTDVNGCTASDTINISVVNGTGISTSSLTTEVYPNPFIDQLTIQLANSNSESVLKLFSDDGKLILEKRITDATSKVELNANNLAPGVYFVSIENNDSKVVKRVVKQ